MRISNAQPCARRLGGRAGRQGHAHALDGKARARSRAPTQFLARTAEAIQARCPADQQSTTSGTDHGGSSYAQAASQSQPSLLLEAQDSSTHDRSGGGRCEGEGEQREKGDSQEQRGAQATARSARTHAAGADLLAQSLGQAQPATSRSQERLARPGWQRMRKARHVRAGLTTRMPRSRTKPKGLHEVERQGRSSTAIKRSAG